MPAVRSKDNLAVDSTASDATSAKSKYFNVAQQSAAVHPREDESLECPVKKPESVPKLETGFPAQDDEREAYRAPSGKVNTRRTLTPMHT